MNKILIQLFSITLVLFPCMAYGQDVEDLILSDIQFDSVSIIQNKVRSVHIYSERSRLDRKNQPGIYTDKTSELEFNAVGDITYKRFVRSNVVSDAIGQSKTYYQKYDFDKLNRLIKESYTDGTDSSSFAKVYDAKGQVISRISRYGSFQENTIDYIWKNGKVIDAIFTENFGNNTSKQPKIKFDTLGQITDYYFDEDHIHTDVTTKNNIKTTKWSRFRNDSLLQYNITTVMVDKNLFLSNVRLNFDGDTLVTIDVKYDAFGNVTFMKHRKWETTFENDSLASLQSHDENTYVTESLFTYDNSYKNGLLATRDFTYTKSEIIRKKRSILKKLATTYRFFYDEKPLPHTYWPEVEIEEKHGRSSPTKAEVIDVETEMIPAPDIPSKKKD